METSVGATTRLAIIGIRFSIPGMFQQSLRKAADSIHVNKIPAAFISRI